MEGAFDTGTPVDAARDGTVGDVDAWLQMENLAVCLFDKSSWFLVHFVLFCCVLCFFFFFLFFFFMI